MKVFVVGATGYIGGTVAAKLLEAGHTVTGTARTTDAVAALGARGIEASLGSFDDLDLLARLSKEADAVISAASADHWAPLEAMLKALAGSNKAFIHTSGSSVVASDAQGELVTEIYDEDFRPEPVPEKVARVSIDQRILDAAGEGIRTVVVCPTLVYGHGLGLHEESIQVPMLVAHAKSSGVAAAIGRGENVWSNVHVEDLADLYLLALERAPAKTFLFAASGEASMKDVAKAIGVRYSLPVGTISVDDATSLWGFEGARLGLASNSRVRATKARTLLGWNPRRPALLETIAFE